MRPTLTDDEVTKFREDICRVAEVLFARHGVEGVTMRQIAAELGCSYTTAYRYFRSREEILAAVRAAAFNRFCQVMEDATRSSADPRKSARNVGQAYLDFALENPDAYRMMFDVSQADVTGNPGLTEALARARRSMVAYVKPLIDIGVLHGKKEALGQMLWASAHGLVMLRLSGIVENDAELRHLHEKTMTALVRGFQQTETERQAGVSLKLPSTASGQKGRKKPS